MNTQFNSLQCECDAGLKQNWADSLSGLQLPADGRGAFLKFALHTEFALHTDVFPVQKVKHDSQAFFLQSGSHLPCVLFRCHGRAGASPANALSVQVP